MRLHTCIDGRAAVLPAAECFDLSADIVVVGLGTAGSMAVLQAAREGFSVLGIDRLNAMGGQGGTGCVWDYYYGCGGGLQEEVTDACRARLQAGGYVTSQRAGLNEESFPGPVKSAVLEEMATDAGARQLYGTSIAGVYREGSRVCGLLVTKDEQTLRIGARVVIDATGDAQAALLAGCTMLPPRLADRTHQYVSKAKSICIDEGYVLGAWSVCGRVDMQSPAALSRAILQATADPFELGDAHAGRRTVYTAPLLGAREGLRIDSLENLILSDVLDEKQTAEPICFASSHVDSFNRDLALEDECLQDYQGICDLRGAILSVGIPMKSLIPRGVDGLLVAGRCIGVDHNIAACVRMKRDMEKTGEAAAIIAAESLRRGIPAAQVPYDAVRDALARSGCLSERHRHPWLRSTRWTDPAATDKQPYRRPDSCEDMHAMLASDAPGIALWCCKKDPGRWQQHLLAWLEDAQVAPRAALALGMMRSPAALPLLRQMAQATPSVPDGGDAWKALCLLGRYGCLEDCAIHQAVLSRPMPPDGARDMDTNVWVYMFLQAQMGLQRLLECYPSECAPQRELLARILFAPGFMLPLSPGRVELADTARRLALPYL